MTTTAILGIVPGLQATSLVAHNLKVMKNFNMKKSSKMSMKKPIKKMVGLGVTNLVGIGLIKPTSQMINNL